MTNYGITPKDHCEQTGSNNSYDKKLSTKEHSLCDLLTGLSPRRRHASRKLSTLRRHLANVNFGYKHMQ